MLPIHKDKPLIHPPWSEVGKQIESSVRKAFYNFDFIPKNGKMAIALSGGKDSITLMLMLKAISGRGFPPFEMTAIHVGGDFTCGAGVTVNFLKSICDGLEIPLILKESTQKLETLECYSCSRERRSLIFNAAKEAGATTIAFGHTQDDMAQTLIMNLIQKGHFEGMLPQIHMKKYGVDIIRPLVYVLENDIRTFAKQQNFLRVSCQCPKGQNSMRKKVDRLIEDMNQLIPEARLNISRAALLFGSRKATLEE